MLTRCKNRGKVATSASTSTANNSSAALNAKIHYTSFSVASPQQVRNINDKSVTSPQQVGAGKSPLCVLCRIVSQIPLQRLVANLLRTCSRLVGRVAKAPSILATIAAEIGDCSRQCGQGLTSPQQVGNFSVYGEVTGKGV